MYWDGNQTLVAVYLISIIQLLANGYGQYKLTYTVYLIHCGENYKKVTLLSWFIKLVR